MFSSPSETTFGTSEAIVYHMVGESQGCLFCRRDGGGFRLLPRGSGEARELHVREEPSPFTLFIEGGRKKRLRVCLKVFCQQKSECQEHCRMKRSTPSKCVRHCFWNKNYLVITIFLPPSILSTRCGLRGLEALLQLRPEHRGRLGVHRDLCVPVRRENVPHHLRAKAPI